MEKPAQNQIRIATEMSLMLKYPLPKEKTKKAYQQYISKHSKAYCDKLCQYEEIEQQDELSLMTHLDERKEVTVQDIAVYYLESDRSYEETAAHFGLHRSTILSAVRTYRAGGDIWRIVKGRRPQLTKEQRQRVIDLCSNTRMTRKEIGIYFGLTTGAVTQIIRRHRIRMNQKRKEGISV